MENLLIVCRKAAIEYGYKPYNMAALEGKPVEIISFPYPTDCGKVCILVREPDDPTSMREALIPHELIQDLG